MSTNTLFDTQTLLFGKLTHPKSRANLIVPEHYYKHGWTVLDNISTELDAVEISKDFISKIDPDRLPLQKLFQYRIDLAKADHIPVCDDIITTSFQVLHFDMGHPFIESSDQLLITHVGIYLPLNTAHKVTAKTRLLELDNLLKGVSADKQIEAKILKYVKSYGDGWGETNTQRLACFARFLDALKASPEFQNERDKTVGQWFHNEEKTDEATAHQNEIDYYSKHGIDLSKQEKQIALRPGQLLIVDNSRVVHGRIGKRKAKELFNFMFGLPSASPNDIKALRKYICSLIV
jgi:hypothetical protein